MKSIFKTKTFWGGIASLATGVGLALSGNIPGGVKVGILGLLSIFGRDAILKVENGVVKK